MVRTPLSIAAGSCAGGAALLIALCNLPFIPFASAGAFGVSIDASVWGFAVSGFGEDDFMSWYNNDADDSGIWKMQVAAPMLALSAVFAGIAAGTSLTGRPRGGAGNAGVGAALAIAGTVLLTIGIMEDDGSEIFDLAVGFYLIALAGVALIVATVLGFLPGASAAPRYGQPMAATATPGYGAPPQAAGRPGQPRTMATAAGGASAAAPGAGRVRCPRCKSIVLLVPGQPAKCKSCGYSA